MGFADLYLAKNNVSASVLDKPNPELGLIIVIPSYNEPDMIRSLNSLWNCQRPNTKTEVIIVVNAPENKTSEIENPVVCAI